MRGLIALYSWRFPATLITILQAERYRMRALLGTFWQAKDISEIARSYTLRRTKPAMFLLWLIRVGVMATIVAGITLIVLWQTHDVIGGWQFGAALLIGYPIIWAHLLAIPVWLSYLVRPKHGGRQIICHILEAQVVRLRKKHHFTVVAVAGSIGKTSTKAAIAKTLGASKRVVWQEGNYNDRVTVPLVFFERNLPNLFNLFAWIKVLLHNQRTITRPYPYDIAVVELGTDAPGYIEEFAYLKPDILVVTAIAPEHMEYFGTLDAVAQEELSMVPFSKRILVNSDDTPAQYTDGITYTSYGLSSKATYHASDIQEKGIKGQHLKLHLGKSHAFEMTIPMLGIQGAKMAVAAAAVAHLLKLDHTDIEKGLTAIEAFAGRMRIFRGVQDATLIDDTYNASPISVKAALDVMYATKASQRIAILGSMNELGDYAPDAHREVGEYCDTKKLDMVITIGAAAKQYLAPAAKSQGCTVKSFQSPYRAGTYVKKHLKRKALVLAKGSQNGVFAEEALKQLLADHNDSHKMVRQSEYWMRIKRRQFDDAPSE